MSAPGQVYLKGIAAVAGNGPVAQAAANVVRVCDPAQRDVPMFKGAEAPLVFPLKTAEFVCGSAGLAGADLPPPAGSLRASMG